MNETLLFVLGIRITGWKLIGYAGAFMFTSRWFVQLWASRRAGRPIVPHAFWLISMAGSILLLMYFIFGKNDSVGILSNLFPAFVAIYNLFLDLRNRRDRREDEVTSA
jgi:lipid-A-disaccharide synthase-like uncharacterized protein